MDVSIFAALFICVAGVTFSHRNGLRSMFAAVAFGWVFVGVIPRFFSPQVVTDGANFMWWLQSALAVLTALFIIMFLHEEETD